MLGSGGPTRISQMPGGGSGLSVKYVLGAGHRGFHHWLVGKLEMAPSSAPLLN